MGKTNASVSPAKSRKKHPHARGEDARAATASLYSPETPPRTWGRRIDIFVDAVSIGNTPTHVGKTSLCKRNRAVDGKHPHARGEDRLVICATPSIGETPPRTWGRLSLSAAFMAARRNTPTHVGKTYVQALSACLMAKHPHARGEDLEDPFGVASDSETPPRTWGRHLEFISFFPFYFQ